MGAIPNSNLPGHRRLHERAVAALGRCQESQAVDFKESAPWDDLKWHVVHSVLAMGNLRDGGIIVVGVSQRDSTWDLTGVEHGHLATFDPDTIIDQVNKHVSPPVTLDIVLVEQEGKQFLAIQVNEFDATPLVCKKNGPDNVRAASALKEGAVFVRPPGMAKTTRVMSAEQMADLLELAAEKRARRILEASRRIGMVAQDTDRERFEAEAATLLDSTAALPVPAATGPHWRVVIRPDVYEEERIQSLAECFHLVEQARVRLRGWDFPHLSNRQGERTQGANWVASWANFMEEVEYWRLHQSGQLVHLHAVEEALNVQWTEQMRAAEAGHRRGDDGPDLLGCLSYLNMLYRVAEVFEFASRVCQRGVYQGRVHVGVWLRGIRGFGLTMRDDRFWRGGCVAGEDTVGRSWAIDSADLVASAEERTLDAALWLLERFGWMSPPREVVGADLRAFLERRN